MLEHLQVMWKKNCGKARNNWTLLAGTMDLMRWIQKQKRHRDDVDLDDDGVYVGRKHRSKSIDPESLSYQVTLMNLAHHVDQPSKKLTPPPGNLLSVEQSQRRRSDDLGLADKKSPKTKSKHKR